VKFDPGVPGQGVATEVDILAAPGSAFVFSGQLSFLDSHSGRLVIADPRDNQSYEVFFHPSQFPASRQLREGSYVRVTATFDGSRYVATNIRIE
jgi:cold shock CspA family protein